MMPDDRMTKQHVRAGRELRRLRSPPGRAAAVLGWHRRGPLHRRATDEIPWPARGV